MMMVTVIQLEQDAHTKSRNSDRDSSDDAAASLSTLPQLHQIVNGERAAAWRAATAAPV